ncbi:MAG: helix-turn-helix transcriptional regulator [Clostridia bacterium]|nr:helix-turn-helix transcriptional regulator [Clostridia bacterium]
MEFNDLISTEFNNFCNNIKKLRIDNNLTKKAMAEKLKVSTRTIRMLENHQIPRTLTIEVVLEIMRAFNVDGGDLFK